MGNVDEAGNETIPCKGHSEEKVSSNLTAAQRARIERQRLRARSLVQARLLTARGGGAVGVRGSGGAAPGGFVPEEAPPPAPLALPAPLPHVSLQPHCVECGRPFPQSYLYDTFDYEVCDECRDDDGAHALITRTDAKAEFLLQDCDLDARPPPHDHEYGEERHDAAADAYSRECITCGHLLSYEKM